MPISVGRVQYALHSLNMKGLDYSTPVRKLVCSPDAHCMYMSGMNNAILSLYTIYTSFGAYTACNTQYQLTLMDVVEAGTTL